LRQWTTRDNSGQRGSARPQTPIVRQHGGASRSLITFVVDRPGHDRRYAIDATRVRSELGWRPRETFADGLRKTVAWYVGHLDWIETVMRGRYSGERLGVRS